MRARPNTDSWQVLPGNHMNKEANNNLSPDREGKTPFTEQADEPDQQIARWVRPELLALKAYHVNDASGLIKLDAMENPFELPESIRSQAIDHSWQLNVNRYPDPEARHIKTALRKLYGLDKQTAMLFGNGSDEIIQILAMVLGGPGRTILSVEPGFVMYKAIAAMTGSDYAGVPLTNGFNIDVEATLAAVRELQPSLIFIAQPNNPTGKLVCRPCSQSHHRSSSGDSGH